MAIQTLTQAVTVTIPSATATAGGLTTVNTVGVPNTGIESAHLNALAHSVNAAILIGGIAVLLLAVWLLYWRFYRRRRFRGAGIGIFLLAGIFGLVSTIPSASATSLQPLTLALAAQQQNLALNAPQGGGTISTETTIITGTENVTGYTLTAELTKAEPGVGVHVRGGAATTNTPLTAGDTPLLLKTTSAASNDDTTTLALDVTTDNSVTAGVKTLSITYKVEDNAPPAATSIFGANYPYTATYYNDGGGSLKVASLFYSHNAAFTLKGGRVYLPSAPSGASLTVFYVVGWNQGGTVHQPSWSAVPSGIPGQYATIPSASVVSGWNEIAFPNPVLINPYAAGVDGTSVWVGYYFSDGNGYVYTASPTAGAIASTSNANLFLAESGFEGHDRSSNNITSNGDLSNALYGVDILTTGP